MRLRPPFKRRAPRAWQTPALALYIAVTPQSPDDVPAPDRPSVNHVWTEGVGWVIPADVADRIAAREVDALADRLLFEVNFNQENRLRALEGKAAITRAQYRSALVALVKQLNGG